MTAAVPRLEIKDLKRSYNGRPVVDGVSLRIMPGQVTCLLGPSGCGKSTTLRMIAGVEMQDSGTIHVDGALICDTVFRVPPERREIGLMFQDFALFPHLSVADNVGFGLKKGTRAEKRARIEELLDRVDLKRFIASITGRATSLTAEDVNANQATLQNRICRSIKKDLRC